MAVTFHETPESRERDGSTKITELRKVLEYVAKGTDDEEEVQEQINVQLPAGLTTWTGVPLWRASSKTKRIAENRHKVQVTYRHPNHDRAKDDPQPDDSTPDNILSMISGEIGGGTIHVTHAIKQDKYGAAAPDHGQLIEVTDDGPKGVDIPAGGLTFTIRWVYQKGIVRLPFIRKLVSLADPANSNDNDWHGFDKGEVLYLGASFTERNNGDFDFNHKFRAGKNQAGFNVDGINVADPLDPVAKHAHDYVWVSSKVAKDAVAKKRKEQTDGVYIAQVHPFGDFENLLMGS